MSKLNKKLHSLSLRGDDYNGVNVNDELTRLKDGGIPTARGHTPLVITRTIRRSTHQKMDTPTARKRRHSSLPGKRYRNITLWPLLPVTTMRSTLLTVITTTTRRWKRQQTWGTRMRPSTPPPYPSLKKIFKVLMISTSRKRWVDSFLLLHTLYLLLSLIMILKMSWFRWTSLFSPLARRCSSLLSKQNPSAIATKACQCLRSERATTASARQVRRIYLG